MSIKELKVWKTIFYKNMSAEGGALKQAINNKPSDHVIVHSQTQKYGRMWGFTNNLSLLKLLEKNHGIYEVMTTFPFKVYFDIDKKVGGNGNEYLAKIKKDIQIYFPHCEFAVSGSITDEKTSFHIVLNNYMIHNEEERNHVKMK